MRESTNGKSKFLGVTVEIKGNNVNAYECIVCGSKLQQREYNQVTDMCNSCKRISYGKGKHVYKMRGGNNNIDEILTRKVEGTK